MILICENQNGDIKLEWQPRLVAFSALRVWGSLWLEGCSNLRSVGAGLLVGGTLDLEDCSALRSLPDGLVVGGDLWLCGTTSLTTLPSGLWVGAELDLFGSSVASVPKDAKIEGVVLGRS